jgi:hypothetical protein
VLNGSVAQEEDLEVKAPGSHVLVEISQVGVISYGFVSSLPAEASRKPLRQTGLAGANVSSHQNEMFSHVTYPTT